MRRLGADRRVTPLGAVVRGLAAGVAGTAVMDLYQAAKGKALERMKGEGPKGREKEGAPRTWEEAPAPARVGRRVLEGLFLRKVPKERAGALTYGVHWAYGIGWGAVYGLVQSTGRFDPLRHGLAFGTGVFGAAYVVLPAMRIYDPIWRYRPTTLALDLSQHLVYGVGVAGAYRALQRA